MMMVSNIAISLAPSVQAAPLICFGNEGHCGSNGGHLGNGGGHLGNGAGQQFGLSHNGPDHKPKKTSALIAVVTVDWVRVVAIL